MTKIENEIQYICEVARVEDLLPLVDDNPSLIELELLSNLAADYSEEYFAIGWPKRSEVMELRRNEMGLTQKKLADIMEVSQSRISEYLTGKSEPTIKAPRKINKNLNIDPAIILGL